ncbi:TonB-dependent receptor [Phenylobacterium sp.]|uniref:TonB-dependent receptor domain-containing protein n=1 Tax=Phenylobacterium sp. TaxID=1871053 RepID=UPI0025EF5E3B|nr:TonB-dependent receptor [Phenylobacterium sp.]
MKHLFFRGASALAVVACAGLWAGAAAAQTGGASAPSEVEEVVVTGSYIAGTPQNSALPVSVIGAEELAKQGSPTVVQIIKSLPAAAGSIGEANRLMGATAGVATVNLRGFGAARTLVLFNGRRLAPSVSAAAVGAVDVNLIPTAAIGRIEVLKDGAAATYGSDAVGGVVNFITRTDLDGFEFTGDYAYIKGSNGDYNLTAAWGKKFDRGNALITAGYRRRSELRLTDRDWAIRPFAENPFGGWSGSSNPGGYTTGNGGAILPNGALSQPFATPINFQDDGCTELGGEIVAGTCRFQFSRFDNLANDEYHYQLYGEVNFDLDDDTRFHGEVMWSRHDVPEERVSPYQSTVQFPTPIAASGGSPGGGQSPYPATGLNQQSRFYIPFANPGLTALFNRHCGAGATTPYSAAQCSSIQGYGVITSQTQWRPGGYGGQPLFTDGADHNHRKADAFRISGGVNGKLPVGGWKYDVAVTYMESEGVNAVPDEVVNRVQLGLRGLGGPNCNVAANTPGQNGCYWFNPFSNAIATDAVYGRTNPFYTASAVPSNTNTRELFEWMHQYLSATTTSRILVGDVVASGELPVTLPGGTVALAVGAQWRYDEYKTVADDALSNIEATRCVDDVDDHLPQCTGGVGPFNLSPGVQGFSVDRIVKAVFAEVKIPLLETLTLDGAIRYETYGGSVGSTTNPKADAKWQALPWFAVRGSVGTTFRAPPQTSVQPGFSRTLQQFVDPTSGAALYRAVDTYANPDLKPETASNYSIGGIVELGDFTATVDWWNFHFKKELTVETAAAVYSTMFPNATPAAWQCANPALASRFNFASGAGTAVNPVTGTNCHPANFQGMRTNLINGPSVDTSGVDFSATYRVRDLLAPDGDLTVGVDGAYVSKYERGALRTVDGITIAPAVDRAGKAELLSAFYSQPRWKGNLFLNYNLGPHNFRATLRYVGAMRDLNHDSDTATAGVQPAKIKAWTPIDLVYRVDLPWETTLTATVQNLFDKDPPFAYSPFNYDYEHGSPLGRVLQINVRKRF